MVYHTFSKKQNNPVVIREFVPILKDLALKHADPNYEKDIEMYILSTSNLSTKHSYESSIMLKEYMKDNKNSKYLCKAGKLYSGKLHVRSSICGIY
jgi:hypothetical protein